MELLKNKDIAIIGGGPGGLTLARLLQMQGADVKVYERDASRHIRVQGATLDLHHHSGLKALAAAGLMEAFRANYRPGADKMRITDKSGNMLHEDTFVTELTDEWARPEIDRGPLRDILLDSLQPGTVIWDSQFQALHVQNYTVKLDFKNGTSAYAHMVIAADGASSRVRPYITPIKPFYSGVTAIEGVVYDAATNVPEINQMVAGGKVFALGDAKTFVISAKGDGSLPFYIGFNKPENWTKECGVDFSDKQQVFNWFKQEFEDWDKRWYPLFEKASVPFIPRPQYCMPFDQTWETQPNLTLLGDAAHLMPPYAGEGVNMAMLDALQLAECLLSDSYPDTQTAIAAYEQQMRKRAAAIAQDTMEQTAWLHSAAGLQHILAMFSESR